MTQTEPLLIDDSETFRRAILALETQDSQKARLWNLIRNSARSAPLNFPWFTPFVALVTREAQDIENARQVLRAYVAKLDAMLFGIGMQFHFWCFAFPHAKWSLYFQWLCTLGAFDPEEEERIRRQLIAYHFTNFFYGLRTKPEPECVDNQALSLAFSNALVGYIFTRGQNPSPMAERMLADGLRRLPAMLSGMPASGYSGEGSSYMDCVNGPAVPLAVELLERATGRGDWLRAAPGEGGGTPLAVLRMVAREWMPGGLLLPWDNYGYQFGVRAALAYAARKTGESLFFDLLETDALWSYDIGTGWAYDDLVWTLVWWPERPAGENRTDPAAAAGSRAWFEPEVGGAILSRDQNFYLAQIWDPSAPEIPTRAHVNPNAVLFNGYRVPLSADGSAPTGGCPRFSFPDTRRSVSFLTMGSEDVYNYGDGCGGAHSVVLVDGWEGLRVFHEGPQFASPAYSPDPATICCDAAPLYAERFPDVRAVLRRSSLHCQRFFVVEDLVRFAGAHAVTSRFLLRPDFVPVSDSLPVGVKMLTAEGVSLHLLELLGGDRLRTETVAGFPLKPDGRSVLADFSRAGSEVRRLFVAFISRSIQPGEALEGFSALADPRADLEPERARALLAASPLRLGLRLPAHMEAALPIARRWWYQRRIEKPAGAGWLALPVGLSDARLWLDGEPVDLSPFRTSLDLIHPRVPLPERLHTAREFDFLLRTDVPISHYEGGGDGTLGLAGGVRLDLPARAEDLLSARYARGRIELVTNQSRYETGYTLLDG